MKYLIICPKKNQIDRIKKYQYNISNDIEILENNDLLNTYNKFKKNESNLKDSINVKVLCCHEEGIYWLKNNLQDNFKLSFEEECFDMTDKWNAYKILKENNIPCVNKVKNIEDIIKYPIIAKPSIGFGSIGVRKIRNRDELEKYIHEFDYMMNNSIVQKDKEIFFKKQPNFPVFEDCIEIGQFFSVPFIVDSNNNIKIFPVLGLRKENTDNSNYKWATFMYGKNILKKEIYNKIKNIIEDISDKWIKEPSVNVVEMIYDFKNDNLNVLEFSPRVVGGRISKLIEYAIGINLDDISIDLFFDVNSISIKEKKNKITVVDICNINEKGQEISQCNDKNLEKFKLVYTEVVKSPIGNSLIKYKIYEGEYKDNDK